LHSPWQCAPSSMAIENVLFFPTVFVENICCDGFF
jgi:hypothetical protein